MTMTMKNNKLNVFFKNSAAKQLFTQRFQEVLKNEVFLQIFKLVQ